MIVAAMTINPVFRVMGILHVPRLTLCGFRNSHGERKNHKFISAAVLSDGLPWINLYLIFNTHNSVKLLILQNTAGCRRDISTFLYYLMVWTNQM